MRGLWLFVGANADPQLHKPMVSFFPGPPTACPNAMGTLGAEVTPPGPWGTETRAMTGSEEWGPGRTGGPGESRVQRDGGEPTEHAPMGLRQK